MVMLRRLWFYQFYSLSDFIKGTILFIILMIALIPFDVLAITFAQWGSWTFVVLVSPIILINLGIYIRAIVLWIIYIKQTKNLPEPPKNVDPVWLGIHS